MSFAQGSRSKLSLKAQPDYLTAASGNFVEVPFSTHDLTLNKQAVESATNRSDREVSDSRHGNGSAGGSINTELRYGDAALELLMQSAMFNVWASSEMTIGTQRTFLSVEDGALDIAQYRRFVGMEVNRMSIDIQPNAMVTAAFELAGRDMTVTGSSGAGTIAAPTTNVPMDSFSGFIYDEFPGSGTELGIVTGLSFEVNNGVNPTAVVGVNRPNFQEYGRGRVTGQLTCYWRDATFINRFVNETEIALHVQCADPSGNDYVFTMPRVKFNGASVPHQGEQSRIITLPFIALRGTGTITSALRIQK
jgi:hypothetical protein